LPKQTHDGDNGAMLLVVEAALVSNDLTLETSCTDFLVYASAGMITV
jgi:hypothetical protein